MKFISNGEKRAVIYTRVSTDDQAEFGYSLAHQEEVLRKECEKRNVTIVKHFQDDGYSAKTFKRPAFKQLLEFVKNRKNHIQYLYVVRWDRFSRFTEDSYRMIGELRTYGVDVKCLEEQFDSNDPASVILRAIKLAEPEMDNRRRALNTKMGIRRSLKEGRFGCGTPPKGYCWIRDQRNKPLITPGCDSILVKEAFELYATGLYSVEGVRKIIVEKGLKISKSQFYLLLKNPIYMGKIVVPATEQEEEQIVEGLHQPLISEELFWHVQQLLKKVKQKNLARSKKELFKEELPLRGMLKCPICENMWTGSQSKGRSKGYLYYHCQKGCKQRVRAEEANQAFLTYLKSFQPFPEVVDLYLTILEDTFRLKEGDIKDQCRQLKQQCQELEVKLLNIDEMFISQKLEADSYHRLKKATKENLGLLNIKINELEQTDSNFVKHCRYGLFLLTHLDLYYEETSTEIKQKLLGSIFPEKLVFENGKYRTTKINEAIALISGYKKEFDVKNEGQTIAIDNLSYDVPRIGLEPTHLSAPEPKSGVSTNFTTWA